MKLHLICSYKAVFVLVSILRMNSSALTLSTCLDCAFPKYEFIQSETFDVPFPHVVLFILRISSFAIFSAISVFSWSYSVLLCRWGCSSSKACFSFNNLCLIVKAASSASAFKRAEEVEEHCD